MTPSKVCKSINFKCGCLTTYHFKGDVLGQGWVVIPCKDHSNSREEVKEFADLVWSEYSLNGAPSSKLK